LVNILNAKDSKTVSILNETNKNIQSAQKGLYDLINKLNPTIEAKTERIKKQAEESTASGYLKQIESLQRKLNDVSNEKEAILRHCEEDKQFLMERVKQLEQENSTMTEKLIKKAKDVGREHYDSTEYLKGNKTGGQTLDKSRVGGNISIGPIGARFLTKNMLLELINEIYNSKANYDRKCFESKLPRETMEQHMYTYLNQKYGLKNLIVEWAASIINGIKMYSTEDSDVLLFGKILRNEIEEESVSVISKLKITINDLLQYYLKAKLPLKSHGEILELTHVKMNTYLNEEEWKSIIYYIYENEDAKLLEMKICDHVERNYLDNNRVDNLNK
jgi:hypothetical protein